VDGYAGTNYPFLTLKERDIETGLDYFGARYYASTQGRFTGADEVWKDSHVSDPQSWNKYAYVRNNPLKYLDPTGEKATVTIDTDEEHKRGKITVTASIALWTSTNSGLSQEDLQKAAQEYKSNIEKAWSGTYEQGGITYEVSTTVDVHVYSSENAATDSNAQNVLQVTPGEGHSGIRPASVFGGPDRGEIKVDAGIRNSEAAHEFTHILGVNDRGSGAFLSNTTGAQRAMSATAYDYGWAFGGAINSHRTASRQYKGDSNSLETRSSPMFRLGPRERYRSTRELGAPLNTGTGFDWWR
jgi:RHS repeat-associated protein